MPARFENLSPGSLLAGNLSSENLASECKSSDWRFERPPKFHNLSDPYLTGGRKAYVIGTQDGRFPDLGGHVPGEMGGLWMQPIKVADGFWLGFGEDPHEAEWLGRADAFYSGPLGVRFTFPPQRGLRVECEVWAPHDAEAIIVTYRVARAPVAAVRGGGRTGSGEQPFVFLIRTDLRGVWLSERLGWEDGFDRAEYRPELGGVHAWDEAMPFHACVGAVQAGLVEGVTIDRDLWGPERTSGKGVSIAFRLRVPLDGSGKAEFSFVFSGSSKSREAAELVWRKVARDLAAAWEAKARAVRQALGYSRLEVADQAAAELFERAKEGFEALFLEVEGMGQGLTAGVPEYPWWFGCDNSYALQGALCAGRFDIAKETLRLLAGVSERTNGNGRVIHEVTTAGVVSNPGNTQETAHFVVAAWEAFLWTGDRAFIEELYPLCKRGVLHWLLKEQDTDGDLFPEGYGITEVAGLNWELIDTAVYTWQALNALAGMAEVTGDAATAGRARALSEQLARQIEERFWLEDEGLYADVIASPRMLLERIDRLRGQRGNEARPMQEALDRVEAECRRLDPDMERPWLFKNWVIFCPLEAGLAPPPRAGRVIERMLSPEFVGRFGLYLNGTLQDRVMTISTGVAAVALARYGRMNAALGMIHQMAATTNLRTPGAPSEMSPDYGCFLQAWTGYGAVYTVVRQFLGVSPRAHEKRVVLSPRLPDSWGDVKLRSLRIGEALVDLAVRADRQERRLEVDVDGLDGGWTISLEVDPEWVGLSAREAGLVVNGRLVDLEAGKGADEGVDRGADAVKGADRGAAGNGVRFEWKATGRDRARLEARRAGDEAGAPAQGVI